MQHIWRKSCLALSLAVMVCSSCQCDADIEPGWEFEEGLEKPDLALEEDMIPDMIPDMPEDMVPDLAPEERWVEERVLEDVPFDHALNDRTSLVVDSQGTIWLGYHACDDLSCSDPRLVVARRPVGGEWTYEDVDGQKGTFGVDVFGRVPYTAYLSEARDSFMVAMRDQGPEANDAGWTLQRMPVNFTGPYDGLDLTHEAGRLFVSFANNDGDPIWFFTMDLQKRNPRWEQLERLDVGRAQAALERGLQSDGKGKLYLVHRRGSFGAYGVAAYDMLNGEWEDRTYFDDRDYVVSSLVVTRDDKLCMSGESAGGRLQVTCGTMEDLAAEKQVFNDQPLNGYNSLIEGTDGSLVVAFNWGDNQGLKVGRRGRGEREFRFEQIYERGSWGVSTALDNENKLLVSYYTCREQRCSLELLRQTYLQSWEENR